MSQENQLSSEFVKVSEMQKGMRATGFFLVRSMAVKTSANDKMYGDYVLADQTGEINAKLWDVADPSQCPQVGAFMKVQGLVTEWQEKLQFRMDKFREVNENDPVDIGDFVPTAPEPLDLLMDELHSAVASIQNPDIAGIVGKILADCQDQMAYFPAALRNHHAIRGGLLYHTVSMLRVAEGMLAVYTWLDADLVNAGIILHDMAKIVELESTPVGVATRYTRDGQLLGHIQQGMTMVERAGRELGADPEICTLLQHMILAHHYEPEFGSPKRPMFPEAEALHYLDILDARMYDMNKILSDVEPGGFSDRVYVLHNRQLYRKTFDSQA